MADINAQAAEVAKRMKLTTVYSNSRGEFFTSENLATNSESGNKKNVVTHDFTAKPAAAAAPTADANTVVLEGKPLDTSSIHPDGVNAGDGTVEVTLTQADIDNSEVLREQGAQAGDVVKVAAVLKAKK